MRKKSYTINQSIPPTPHSLWKRLPRGWPQQTDLHLSLSMHSVPALSNSYTLTPLSLTYSFILSSHLPSGLPLLLGPSTILRYTFLTNSSFSILSMWPNHLRVLLFTHSTAPHPTPLPCPLLAHLSYTLSLLTPPHTPSTHSTRSSQVTHLYSTHSRLLHPIPCPVLRPICYVMLPQRANPQHSYLSSLPLLFLLPFPHA